MGNLFETGIYQGEEKVVHFVRQKTAEAGSSSSASKLDEMAYALLNRCSGVISPPSIFHLKIFKCPICGDQSHLSGVIVSCLDCFLDGCELYRFEYGVPTALFLGKFRGGCCSLIDRDSTEDVLHHANYLYKHEIGFGGYNLFENNCEDFAIYCMTGKLAFEKGKPVPHSTQIAAAKAFCNSLPSLLSDNKAAAIFTYFSDRWKSDLKNLKDVQKISVEDLFNYFKNNPPPPPTPTPPPT